MVKFSGAVLPDGSYGEVELSRLQREWRLERLHELYVQLQEPLPPVPPSSAQAILSEPPVSRHARLSASASAGADGVKQTLAGGEGGNSNELALVNGGSKTTATKHYAANGSVQQSKSFGAPNDSSKILADDKNDVWRMNGGSLAGPLGSRLADEWYFDARLGAI